MSWRPRAPVAIVATVAMLSLVAFLPLASADHAYSHRYIVFGRVLDAENNPVPGLQVDLGTSSVFKPEGACANQPGTGTDAWAQTATNPITNQYGEFFFCYHVHPMSRSEPGDAIVTVEGEEHSFTFDGFMRYSYTEVKLKSAHPNANKTIFSQSHTIQGRAWESTGVAEHKVEGIRVFGDTLHNQPVTISFAYNGKAAQTLNTTTNNYGDFAVRVPVTERPTSGEVTVTIGNHTWTEPVGDDGATAIRAQVGEAKTSNVPAPALLAIVGVIGLAALALRRRNA